MLKFISSLFLFILIISCTQAPTKVYEAPSVNRGSPAPKLIAKTGVLSPIEIKPETVVLDTRAPFVFTLSHLPGSINMSWQEFTETNLKHKGLLVKDLFSKARRLARLGISPESHVVVIGDGKSGHGEEGRLAWTLKYLGVKNVEFVGKDYFDQARWIGSHVVEAPRAAQPMWKPNLDSTLVVEISEIKKYIVKSKDLKPKDSSKVMEGEIGESNGKLSRPGPVIIDCRTAKDYFSGSGVSFSPQVRVVNIQWSEFVDDTGRPDPSIKAKLSKIQITPDSRIIVLSDNGLESGAVVAALTELGFGLAGHMAGGYGELLRK